MIIGSTCNENRGHQE